MCKKRATLATGGLFLCKNSMTMKENRLHLTDSVKVVVALGSETYTYYGSGFGTLDKAIRAAHKASPFARMNIEDCVFTVDDITEGTSARYRVNAGDNVRILPEE